MRFGSLTVGLALIGAVAAAQGRSGNETEEEQTFQAAERAFADKKFDDALSLYEKVTAINPSRPEPWSKRGRILVGEKKYNDAVKLMRQAQQSLPNDPGIKGVLGLALYQTGAKDLAVGMMEEVVAASPAGYPELQVILGQFYLGRGDGKRAATAFEAYLKTRAEEAAAADGAVRMKLGRAYLLNHQYQEAESLYEGLLKTNPNDKAARAGLGDVFVGKGECSKAITIFERLLPEAQKLPSIYYNLGSCYLKVNRFAEAQKTAEQYTASTPKDARGFVLLGEAREGNRDLGGALAAYESAKKLEPGSAQVARGMGRVYVAQKNFSTAIGVLEAADKAKPDDPQLLVELAEAYVQTRQPKEKLIAIGERLAKASDADALTEAGVAFYVAGEDGRAVKLYAQALEKNPQARRAKSAMAMALSRQAASSLLKDNLAAAETDLTQAQNLDGESVQTNRNLGLVLLLEKKYPDAERVLKIALKKVPRDVVVNRLLGRVMAATHRRDEAIRVYEVAASTALRTRGPALAEVYAELGPIYVEAGKLEQAVTVLDTAVKEAGQTPALLPSQRNLAIALYRRGLDRLKDPKLAEPALDDLTRASSTPKPALSAKEIGAMSCGASLAALAAGKAAQAQDGFNRASKEGGCQFRAPYDKIGLEFFSAYAAYRDTREPAKREAAAKSFQKFSTKATGQLASLLRELVRSSFELEGYDYFVRGDEGRASVAMKSAARVAGKGERRELDNNLAVVEMLEGKSGAAEKTFEELGQRPPEALVNLGILADRQGDSKRALELYKKGNDRGARAPKLREWIDVKERLLAGSGGGK
jgi:tetratricopeptide (TPR) repeat protein